MNASACGTCGALRTPESSPGGLCPACLLTAALSDPGLPDLGDDDFATDGLPPGTTVGPFRIGRPLGRGGMATVYEAQDLRLDRAVALKILPAEFLHDQTFARRFETEARLIARLEHRNIIPIYASGIDEGIPWMSMRLLTGKNLGVLLGQRRLAPLEAVRLLREVAAALDYAHGRGVVHRDIKPANILLDGSGTACVADFGLAQLMGAGHKLTRTGMLTGTPHYMAPEQALGKPVDHRCDIYSLGIVAYEMLVGEIPFTAESPIAVLLQHVHEALPPPADRLSLPPLWMDVIRKATAKDPAARWASAGAFVEALGFSIGGATPQRDDADDGVLRRTSRSKAVLTAIAAGALVGAVGFLWVSVRQPTLTPPEALNRPVPTAQGQVPPAAAPAPMLSPDSSVTASREVKPTTPARPPNSPAMRASRPSVPPAGLAAPQSAPESTALVPPRVPALPPVVAEIPVATDPLTTVPGAATPTPRAPDVFADAQLIRKVRPPYPAAAISAELEGEVILSGVVGVDGRVREVTIQRSLHPLLDDAARKAVLQYVYRPAQRNGIPEPVRKIFPIQFKLEDRP